MIRLFLLLLSCLPALSGGQTLLVLNKADNSLSFLDPGTLKVLKTIPTGEGPHEVCVSDDGETAFVAHYGHQQPGNSIGLIDVARMTEIKRIDLGPLFRPHGLVFADGAVFGTAEGSRAVFRYHPAKDKLDWIMGTGQSVSHMLAVLPGAEKMYTADILSNTVTVLHFNKPPLPEFCRRIPVGPKPEAIAVTPSGTEVWVGHNEDGKIRVIDTATDTVVHEFIVGKMPIRIHFTPDGKRALISDPPAGELIVADVVKRDVLKRIALPGAPVGIAIAPDGKSAFVALTQTNEVARIDLAALTVSGKGATGKNPDGIAWSPITPAP